MNIASTTPPAAADLDPLLAPIPGEHPAGDLRAYAYRVREQVQELRREERPEDFDDATRPAELKKADWPGLVQLCRTILVEEAKDLRIACHLVEGLVKTEGFCGLRDGLALIGRMIDDCWDRMSPEISDGDFSVRGELLANMLDDPDRGIALPNSVRWIPLFGSTSDGYGLAAWKRLRAIRDPDAAGRIAKALALTPPQRLRQLLDAIHECVEELTWLVPLLESRLGGESPALTNLRKAVEECRLLVEEELTRMNQPLAIPLDSAATGSADAPAVPQARTTPPGPAGAAAIATAPYVAVATRSDAYARLAQAAELLEQLEPHSPIPYLVRRAVELGRLPFPQLMRQLIRDGGVLAELNRELGVSGTGDGGPAAGDS